MTRSTVYYNYGLEDGKTARYQDLEESSVETNVGDIIFEIGEKFTARREADYRRGYHDGYVEVDAWLNENVHDDETDDSVDVMAEVNDAALADIEANDELYAAM